jgi:hypothetical protein
VANPVGPQTANLFQMTSSHCPMGMQDA